MDYQSLPVLVIAAVFLALFAYNRFFSRRIHYVVWASNDDGTVQQQYRTLEEALARCRLLMDAHYSLICCTRVQGFRDVARLFDIEDRGLRGFPIYRAQLFAELSTVNLDGAAINHMLGLQQTS